ncbi:hypothetical protein CBF90_14410 [Microbacterium sp. AISO3]|uniref:lipopolysaccharide biosynthesis protein n=1 Tax=Microbacterium sp. AISO3 TaxID=2002831 RepID=UPI000B4C8C1F|nr:lipopolysaccharide biosynthesis protein [Microbacterium sp. AISO3]OWP20258.1 hypothetical protein CBF90_17945 [Microbacterium sp. AISO3]OWP20906.1 hypothetical protein CBF90_14410 [Microbacterium sp. AISO3]
MSLAAAAARGAAVTFLGQWIKFLIILVGTGVLARLVEPSDFGLLAMVTAVSGIGLLIADFGLSTASIQKQGITSQEKSNLFWLNTALGTALAAIFFVLATPLSQFYGAPEVENIARYIAIVLVLNALAAQSKAEISRKLRFRQLAGIDVMSQAAGIAVAVSVAAAGGGYWALVWQQVTPAVVQFIGYAILARWVPRLPRRTGTMKPLLAFGMNSLGTQSLNYASNNFDSVIVGKVLGADSLGIYSRAFQLFKVPMQQLAAPMTRVAFPILSRLNGTDKYDLYIARAQLLLTYSLGGVFFGAAALADPLIDIYLGPGWDEAKPVFYILSVGGVFQGMGYVYYWIFLSKAMTGLQLRFTIISRPIMIALTAAGVFWGINGVAAGFAAGLVVNWVVLTAFALPRTGVNRKLLLKATLRPLALYSLMLALLTIVSLNLKYVLGPVPLLLLLITLALIYLAAAILAVKPIRRDASTIYASVKLIRRRGN